MHQFQILPNILKAILKNYGTEKTVFAWRLNVAWNHAAETERMVSLLKMKQWYWRNVVANSNQLTCATWASISCSSLYSTSFSTSMNCNFSFICVCTSTVLLIFLRNFCNSCSKHQCIIIARTNIYSLLCSTQFNPRNLYWLAEYLHDEFGIRNQKLNAALLKKMLPVINLANSHRLKLVINNINRTWEKWG